MSSTCRIGEIASLKEDGWRVRQLIDGYIRYLRQQSDPELLDGSRRLADDDLEDIDDFNDSRFNDSR